MCVEGGAWRVATPRAGMQRGVCCVVWGAALAHQHAGELRQLVVVELDEPCAWQGGRKARCCAAREPSEAAGVPRRLVSRGGRAGQPCASPAAAEAMAGSSTCGGRRLTSKTRRFAAPTTETSVLRVTGARSAREPCTTHRAAATAERRAWRQG